MHRTLAAKGVGQGADTVSFPFLKSGSHDIPTCAEFLFLNEEAVVAADDVEEKTLAEAIEVDWT